MAEFHAAVEAYRADKARYDADSFISSVNTRATQNPQLVWLVNTPEYRAFVGLQTATKPFKKIMAVSDELSDEDLEWLIDNMPSGYPRAYFMTVRREKYGK